MTATGPADVVQRIPHPAGLCPEHVSSRDDDTDDAGWTEAVLLDVWGRAHALRTRTTIGRDRDEATITVLEASVSRLHAELRFDAAGDRWLLRDLGSTNGSSVEGRAIEGDGEVEVGDLMLVGIGAVGFVLIRDGDSMVARRATESLRATVKTPAPARTDGGDALVLEAPASGEGGLVQYRGTSLQLGRTQYALLELLLARHGEQAELPAELRGYVRAVDILANLPWDTPHPGDGNIKQLVRRLRRSLAELGLEHAIESRHGFGYRLTPPG